MKPTDDLKTIYTIYKGKDAQTVADMAEELGISESVIRRSIPKFLQSGRWKEVRVQRNRSIIKAYVRVK